MNKMVNGVIQKMTPEEIAELEMQRVKPDYKESIISTIRERYSIDDELAILRQRDTKPQEFSIYNAYVEQCKAEAKEKVNGK